MPYLDPRPEMLLLRRCPCGSTQRALCQLVSTRDVSIVKRVTSVDGNPLSPLHAYCGSNDMKRVVAMKHATRNDLFEDIFVLLQTFIPIPRDEEYETAEDDQ